MICMSSEKNEKNLLHQNLIPQHSRQVKGHSWSGFPARGHLSKEWWLMLCLPRSVSEIHLTCITSLSWQTMWVWTWPLGRVQAGADPRIHKWFCQVEMLPGHIGAQHWSDRGHIADGIFKRNLPCQSGILDQNRGHLGLDGSIMTKWTLETLIFKPTWDIATNLTLTPDTLKPSHGPYDPCG